MIEQWSTSSSIYRTHAAARPVLRNTRLAPIHGLFRYIAGQVPEAMARCQQNLRRSAQKRGALVDWNTLKTPKWE